MVYIYVMKRHKLSLISALLILLGFSLLGQVTVSPTLFGLPKKGELISSALVDVTGDEREERIDLRFVSTSLSPRQGYGVLEVREVSRLFGWHTLIYPFGKQSSPILSDDPELQLLYEDDVTGDGVADLVIASQAEGSSGVRDIAVYSYDPNFSEGKRLRRVFSTVEPVVEVVPIAQGFILDSSLRVDDQELQALTAYEWTGEEYKKVATRAYKVGDSQENLASFLRSTGKTQ